MNKKMNLSLAVLFVGALSNHIYASVQTDNAPSNAENNNEAYLINMDQIAGSWKQLKGKIQQKWGKFTDDDILKMKGTATELEGILQQKYGYTKEEAKKSMQEFLEENKADITQGNKE